MLNSGEVPKQDFQATVEYEWKHPKNRCPNKEIQPIIKKRITAVGNTKDEAEQFTKVLAENDERPICETCKEDYIRKI